MTNYERLLDLPLREVLKEFGNPDAQSVSDAFCFMLKCDDEQPACADCESVPGGCATVCKHWFDSESAPDANYNEDRWHNAEDENPPTCDPDYEYAVFIHGADLPTTLGFDGENFIDHDGNTYNVDWWRPLGERPQVTENE